MSECEKTHITRTHTHTHIYIYIYIYIYMCVCVCVCRNNLSNTMQVKEIFETTQDVNSMMDIQKKEKKNWTRRKQS